MYGDSQKLMTTERKSFVTNVWVFCCIEKIFILLSQFSEQFKVVFRRGGDFFYHDFSLFIRSWLRKIAKLIETRDFHTSKRWWEALKHFSHFIFILISSQNESSWLFFHPTPWSMIFYLFHNIQSVELFFIQESDSNLSTFIFSPFSESIYILNAKKNTTTRIRR